MTKALSICSVLGAFAPAAFGFVAPVPVARNGFRNPVPHTSGWGSSPTATKLGVCMSADPEPVDRSTVLKQAFASVVGLAVGQTLTFNPETAFAASESVDYAKVREAIKGLMAKDADKGPTLVRLAWHSSGTYDKMSKTGGSYGGTMRFKEELGHGANAGLDKAVGWMEPIKKANPGISYGDLYTLAGAVAIEEMGGPKIAWRAGRKDQMEEAVTPNGRLPDADKGSPPDTAAHLRDIFYRMGFNDQEIVALSGAHALGRCHPNASGYDGPWTPTPTTFNNAYFTLLSNLKWTPREWTGPFQYEDPSGRLMMLPSDIVLLEDKKFMKYVNVYAKDQSKFFSDFAKAFSTLLELGCPPSDLVDVQTA